MPEQTISASILVPFAGPGAGTAPLTWGQRAILHDMRQTGWALNLSAVHELPAGTSVEDVAARLGVLISRYPALRMRLDTDARGNPCQAVQASGEIALSVVDVPDCEEPDDVRRRANDLWHERLFLHLDLYRDWPMHMTVFRHRGLAAYQVWTLPEVLSDGTSFNLIMEDLTSGDTADRRVSDPRAVQILDLGRREQTPPLRRTSDRAMRYWESQLRHIPPLTFGEPTHPQGRLGQRYWHGRFSSPAAYLAMLAIARRTRTDSSRVLLALIATAIGRVTGVNPLTAKVILNNRFRPGFAGAIASVSQNSVLTLDLAGATIDEAVARSRRVSLAAGMYAYYDPEQLDQLIARLDAERGYPARVTCRINDRRVSARARTPAEGADQVTTEKISQKLPETFLAWDGTLDSLPEQAFISVEDYPETVYLQVIFDMACFTEAQVQALLYGVEEVAVAAAFDPKVPTGVGAGLAGPHPGGVVIRAGPALRPPLTAPGGPR
jgi:Condensation domain